MNTPLVSVIVPVYNTEAYLDRCVHSVLAQTYENWELILVDDGSNDECPTKCDMFAQQDTRICVIHQENGGLSAARNAGRRIAKGEFLFYLDSDDCISPNALSRLVYVQLQTEADVVEGGCCKFSGDAEIPQIILRIDPSSSPIFSTHTNVEALKTLIEDHRSYHQTAWGKLFRSSIATTPFLVGKYNEDEYWTYQILEKAKSIVTLNEPLYLYYVRPGSIMQARYSEKRLDGLWAYKVRYQELSASHPELSNILARSFFGSCMFHYQMLLAHKDVDLDGANRRAIIKEMRLLPYKQWKHTLSWKQRVWQSAFRLCPQIIGRFRNLFKIGW